MNKVSSSSSRLFTIAIVTAPVTLVPTSTDPDHKWYSALYPTFETGISENVEIAGPSVPSCPTDAFKTTAGAFLDQDAM